MGVVLWVNFARSSAAPSLLHCARRSLASALYERFQFWHIFILKFTGAVDIACAASAKADALAGVAQVACRCRQVPDHACVWPLPAVSNIALVALFIFTISTE